jgi:hypothetical protein
MLQERWKIEQQAKAAEREKNLRTLKETVAKRSPQKTLSVLRETTALPSIISAESPRIQSVNQLEAQVYGGLRDATSFDSALWQGKLTQTSLRFATKEEEARYCPDPNDVEPASISHPERKDKDYVLLESGERIIANNAKSKAVLDFVRPYVQPEIDARNAIMDFNREVRIHDNYSERTEHVLESL